MSNRIPKSEPEYRHKFRMLVMSGNSAQYAARQVGWTDKKLKAIREAFPDVDEAVTWARVRSNERRRRII